MRRRLIILIALLLSFSTTYGNYSDISPESINAFNTFYNAAVKNSKGDSGLQYLKVLEYALNNIANGDKITAKNSKFIGEMQKLNNEKIFNLELKAEEDKNQKIINSNPVLSQYKNISLNKNFIFKQNGIWYFYNFVESIYFNNNNYLNKENLDYNGITSDKSLVIYDKDTIKFVKDYKIEKIISDDLIYGFPNKRGLLLTLRNNKILGNYYDDDSNFKILESLSTKLTQGVYKNDEKISILYKYIIDNIQYKENPDLTDFKLSSGIETFKNKTGVCEGYIELLQLMLGFNNIPSEIKPGDVIDAADFPYIGHGWLRIFDYYYDPTFDDPLGSSDNKTSKEYKYYKLPRDLLYTDRYDEGQTPEYLKKASLEERKLLIRQNRANIYQKYKNQDYNLLKIYKFKEKYGLSLEKSITIEDLKNKINYGEFDGKNLVTSSNTQRVTSIKYFEINNSNIEAFIESVNYDLSNYTLILWKENGVSKYIISKNSEIK